MGTEQRETRYAGNGHVALTFEDLGGAGGDPLLLVMGLGGSRFLWPQGFIGELTARGFHVAAFDNRDAGESTRLPDATGSGSVASLFRRSAAYSAEDMTDDAVAVLDAMGWDCAHLLGHSMGGILVQRIALRHPARARSITISGAAPSDARGLRLLRYLHPSFIMRMAQLRFPDDYQGNLAFGLAVARILASPGYPFDEATAQEGIEQELAHGFLSFRDDRAMGRQNGARWHSGRLADLRVPALVLHGDDDQILRPAAARRTAALIDGARLVTFPGLGHDLPPALWSVFASEVRALADRSLQPPGREAHYPARHHLA
jgi:pimeloyl-ACP methyl ester carboxylesterase